MFQRKAYIHRENTNITLEWNLKTASILYYEYRNKKDKREDMPENCPFLKSSTRS